MSISRNHCRIMNQRVLGINLRILIQRENKMSIVATIATGARAAAELKCLVLTLEMFEPGASLYVFTDSATNSLIPTSYSIRIHKHEAMNTYLGKTRQEMEALPGKLYLSMWTDFMVEKIKVMEWALENSKDAIKKGVWFLDADISLFARLPVFEAPKTLILSPHYIRLADERKFGHFNGGMIWTTSQKHLDVWRQATLQSRFYEQAALEDVWIACPEEERAELPPQVNLGWWRHGQSTESPPEIEKKLGFQRQSGCMGLKYDGYILQSVHTHWNERSLFNNWIRSALKKIQNTHEPARRFLHAIAVFDKRI